MPHTAPAGPAPLRQLYTPNRGETPAGKTSKPRGGNPWACCGAKIKSGPSTIPSLPNGPVNRARRHLVECTAAHEARDALLAAQIDLGLLALVLDLGFRVVWVDGTLGAGELALVQAIAVATRLQQNLQRFLQVALAL